MDNWTKNGLILLSVPVVIVAAIFISVILIKPNYNKFIINQEIAETSCSDTSGNWIAISGNLNGYGQVHVTKKNESISNRTKIFEVKGNVKNIKWIQCRILQIESRGSLRYLEENTYQNIEIQLLHTQEDYDTWSNSSGKSGSIFEK